MIFIVNVIKIYFVICLWMWFRFVVKHTTGYLLLIVMGLIFFFFLMVVKPNRFIYVIQELMESLSILLSHHRVVSVDDAIAFVNKCISQFQLLHNLHITWFSNPLSSTANYTTAKNTPFKEYNWHFIKVKSTTNTFSKQQKNTPFGK